MNYPNTKRLRGIKLVLQTTTFGYWWYGTKDLNIALTNDKRKWKLVVEFRVPWTETFEIRVEGATEAKVRREFSRILRTLKPLVASL